MCLVAHVHVNMVVVVVGMCRYDRELLASGAIPVTKVEFDELELTPKGAEEIKERWKEQDHEMAVHAAVEQRELEAAEEQRKLDIEEEE